MPSPLGDRARTVAAVAPLLLPVDLLGPDAQQVLRDAPGVILADDPEHGEYPTPADAVGTDPTWVGRIRQSQDDPHALELFVVGDNLRKGAALNAAQIAELLVPEFAARAASVTR